MFTRGIVAALLLVWAGAAFAQSFPSRPVRIMAWSAGTFPDLVARRMAERLAARWGQPVIVENRPGAAGIIAAEATVQAPADGHTLAWGDPVGWHMYLQQAEAGKGSTAPAFLVPVSLIVEVPMVLFVSPQLPVRSLREFVDYSRSRGDVLFYATPGNLSIHHLAFELLASRTGMKLQHAPYKTMGQIMTDVASGQVAAAFSGLGTIAGFLKDGRLRPLAWSGTARFGALPDVPTFAEAGVQDFVVGIQGGLFAHKATPRDLIERLARDIGEATRAPEVVEFVTRAGAVAVGSTPDEFARAAQKDIEVFNGVARACCRPSN